MVTFNYLATFHLDFLGHEWSAPDDHFDTFSLVLCFGHNIDGADVLGLGTTVPSEPGERQNEGIDGANLWWDFVAVTPTSSLGSDGEVALEDFLLFTT